MKNSRRPSLRTPFITTFAAGAAAVLLSGCGSAIVQDQACDGGACTDAPPVLPPGCPATAPASGAACTLGRDLTCTYGSTTTPCGTNPNLFECDSRNGVWRQLISTCNPPPVMCPREPPATGDSCTPGWGNTCLYPAPECNGEAQTLRASCDPSSRRWAVESPVCASAVCPPSAPMGGGRCVSNEVTRNCRYPGMPCGGVNQEVFVQCDPSSGTWSVSIASCNPPPPMCPVSPPPAGATCIRTMATMNCNYPIMQCDGSPQVSSASCDTSGRWVLGVASCNPPAPPDAGMGSRDAGGSPDA